MKEHYHHQHQCMYPKLLVTGWEGESQAQLSGEGVEEQVACFPHDGRT